MENEPTHTPESNPPMAEVPVTISFENRGDRLIALGAWNGLLKVLTLGIYSSWAKTEVRRRIWSFIRINGEPLEYRGTGWELFIGLLFATAIFVLPTIVGALVITFAFPQNRYAMGAYQGVLYLAFFLLIGNAIYRAWRYRLSRSNWRGIRGALVGSPGHYGWTYFWTLAAPIAAAAVCAGGLASMIGPNVGGVLLIAGLVAALWALPWRANKLRGMMTSAMYFGDRPLSYDGRSGPLYKAYLTAWVGCAVILMTAIALTAALIGSSDGAIPGGGSPDEANVRIRLLIFQNLIPLIAIWGGGLILAAVLTASYRARQIRHFAHHTHFEGATFRSTVNGRGLLWVTLSNWALRLIAIVAALALASALLAAAGITAQWSEEPFAVPSESELANFIQIAVAIALIVMFSTIANTIAQFRTARYLMSRLALDGNVDLAAISQSSAADPRRGEGLAQVFELDGF